MKIRFAKETDVDKLLSIYNEYIDTAITFEYKTPSKKEFLRRIKKIQKTYPYIVLEENNHILGYAYAHEYKERKAYSWSVETTIYLDKNICAKGYGQKLYSTLTDILKKQRVKTAYACVTSENQNSLKFHKKLGFQEVGIFHNAGYKLNKWHDIIWLEKPLNKYSIPPSKILKISGNVFNDITTTLNNMS